MILANPLSLRSTVAVRDRTEAPAAGSSVSSLIRALMWLAAWLGAAAQWLPVGYAQDSIPHVGVVAQIKSDPSFALWERALASSGWVNNKTFALEYRITAGDPEKIRQATAELIARDVDVIAVWGAPALRQAYAASRTIPIVAVDLTTDPVAAGYADSYSRPGHNVTGVFMDAPDFAAKWLETLKAAVPGLSRVGAMWDPAPGAAHVRALEGAARSLGIEVQVFEVRKQEDIAKAFSSMRGRVQATILLPSPMLYANSARMAPLAVSNRLPAISIFREFTDAGGAMSYGPSQNAYIERAALLVASILAGARPGDLPIDRPNKFDFIVNLRTLKTLGLSVPDSVLLRADEVIR